MKKRSSLIHSTIIIALLGQTVLSSAYAAQVNPTEIASAEVPVSKTQVIAEKPKTSVRTETGGQKTLRRKPVKKPGFLAETTSVLKEYIQPVGELLSAIKQEVNLTWQDYKLEFIESGQWKKIVFDSTFLFLNNVSRGYLKRQHGVFNESTDTDKVAREYAKGKIKQIKIEIGAKRWETLEKIAQGQTVEMSQDEEKEFLISLAAESSNILQDSSNLLKAANVSYSLQKNPIESVRSEETHTYAENFLANKNTPNKLGVFNKTFIKESKEHENNVKFRQDGLSSKQYTKQILNYTEKEAEKLGQSYALLNKVQLPSHKLNWGLQSPIYFLENESYIKFRNPFCNDTGNRGLRLPFTTDHKKFFTLQGLDFRSPFAKNEDDRVYIENTQTETYYPDLIGKQTKWYHSLGYGLAKRSNLFLLILRQSIAQSGIEDIYFDHERTESYRKFLNNRRKLDRIDGGGIRKVFRDGASILSEVFLGGLQSVSDKRLQLFSQIGASFLDEDTSFKKGLAPRLSDSLVNKLSDGANHLFGFDPTPEEARYTWPRILLSAVMSTAIEKILPLVIRFGADVITNMMVRPYVDQLEKEDAVVQNVPKGPPAAVKQQILLSYFSGDEQKTEYLMHVHNVDAGQVTQWIQEALAKGIQSIQ